MNTKRFALAGLAIAMAATSLPAGANSLTAGVAPSAQKIQRALDAAPEIRIKPEKRVTIKEFKKRVDTPVRVAIGEPITRDVLDPMSTDTKSLMDFLRKATYELNPNPVKVFDLGYEFEERHRN